MMALGAIVMYRWWLAWQLASVLCHDPNRVCV